MAVCSVGFLGSLEVNWILQVNFAEGDEAAIGCGFRESGGARGVVGLRGMAGCRFRIFAGMREPPRTAKAVAAFVPHCATAVHMGGVGFAVRIWNRSEAQINGGQRQLEGKRSLLEPSCGATGLIWPDPKGRVSPHGGAGGCSSTLRVSAQVGVNNKHPSRVQNANLKVWDACCVPCPALLFLPNSSPFPQP